VPSLVARHHGVVDQSPEPCDLESHRGQFT
jgi:hypothetical protein